MSPAKNFVGIEQKGIIIQSFINFEYYLKKLIIVCPKTKLLNRLYCNINRYAFHLYFMNEMMLVLQQGVAKY